MTPDQAETIALRALGWLAGNEDLFPVFLGATGASATEIAGRAQDPSTLASVLGFLVMDDAWILAFCRAADLPPDAPLRALHSLPGAAPVHWT